MRIQNTFTLYVFMITLPGDRPFLHEQKRYLIFVNFVKMRLMEINVFSEINKH